MVVRIGSRRYPIDDIARMLEGSSHFAHRKVELVSVEKSALIKRQTDAFRPGSKGCLTEADCHFRIA